jgi:DNA-binding response OmpR family regulator
MGQGTFNVRVLLADSDKDYLEVTAYALRRAGFDIETAVTGAAVRDLLQSDGWDVVVLDAGIDDVPPVGLCQQVRNTSNAPIVILGRPRHEDEMVAGYQAGIDDWIAKPYSFKHLAVTLESLVRRANRDADLTPARLQIGGLRLDRDAFTATFGDAPLGLTRQEFLLLHILAANANRMVPIARLMTYVWDEASEPSPALVRTVLSHIRTKLRDKGATSINIVAMPGLGYKLEAQNGSHANGSSASTDAALPSTAAITAGLGNGTAADSPEVPLQRLDAASPALTVRALSFTGARNTTPDAPAPGSSDVPSSQQRLGILLARIQSQIADALESLRASQAEALDLAATLRPEQAVHASPAEAHTEQAAAGG